MKLIKYVIDEFDEDCGEKSCYVELYGWHFNLKLLDFAFSKMYKNGTPIIPWTQAEIDEKLKKFSVTLVNNKLYDYIYVANMCKADYWGSSITTDEQLVKYIKDVIDDEDGYEGIVMNRWCADMRKLEVDICWENMI